MGEPRYLTYNDPNCRLGLVYGFRLPPLTVPSNNAVGEWCIEQFGPARKILDDVSKSRWMIISAGQIVWFRDEQDALLFKMRWC